ncbi:MAG: hypothetical protein AAF497_14110, partial [Planctomycetota bacterium]
RAHFRQAGVRLACAADGRPERLVVPNLPEYWGSGIREKRIPSRPPHAGAGVEGSTDDCNRGEN